MDLEGSSLMLNVAHSGADLDIQVPFHLRYGELSSSGHASADILMPDAFFSCPSSIAPVVSSAWPSEFSFLINDSKAIIPVRSESTTSSVGRVSVPVGKPEDLALVEIGTALTILVSFCYLAYSFYRTWCRLNPSHSKSE
ncbi:hypothetical protein K435DRAFT_962829 [Dendrothele bispora CBS 962.96]|uniref:Protein PBN1 n=1 Tax=Dendrothele bispora (strain CBS 962.96) TaxID=1314807 RepID=A0A4S8MJW5_DENBC|nr:hypothetical protein K435DRAFT_962829 [Dendrothele bispora CBS 962.96]